MKDIPGWFDFSGFYDFIASQYYSGVFVEIGTWKGLSITYLADKVKHKPIRIYGVDTFKGTAGEHDEDIDVINGTLFETYCKNITPYPNIVTIQKPSNEAYKDFSDHSIDFVFIDADHHYEAVKEDINNWIHKVKKGGIISGHDYAYGGECGVIPAVDELLPDALKLGNVWYYKL